MSEVRLVIRDAQRDVHACRYGSFSADHSESQSLLMRLFAIGFPLSELVVDLKCESPDGDAAAGGADLASRLNRDFGNLRAVAQSTDFAAAAALVDPVIDRFCETLDDVSQAHPQLDPKCADLERRLRRFLEPHGGADDKDDFEHWDSDRSPF